MAISLLIKYEGDNNTFIWKHPNEDFNNLTRIIVHENQEAIFVRNGVIMDILGPGRYRLDSKNIPILSKAANAITGISIMHSEVYYVNRTVQMALKWGLDSKIRFTEPSYNIPLELGVSGEMNLQVFDAATLLVKNIGTMKGVAWNNKPEEFSASLKNAFRPMITVAVKSYLPIVLREQGLDIVAIDEHLDILSKALCDRINPGFNEYGLDIKQFYILNVILPEDNPDFRKLKELYTVTLKKKTIEADTEVDTALMAGQAKVTVAQREVELEKQATETEIKKKESERKIIEAQAEAEAIRLTGMAEAEIMRSQGYTKQDVLNADVQMAYAEGLGKMGTGSSSGSGSGSIMQDMVGLGVGMAAAKEMGSHLSSVFNDSEHTNNRQSSESKKEIKCTSCGAVLLGSAKFCTECGAKVVKMNINEIVCPNCGSITLKGKFCMECGKPLKTLCPNCGTELPTEGKFCIECGTRID